MCLFWWAQAIILAESNYGYILALLWLPLAEYGYIWIKLSFCLASEPSRELRDLIHQHLTGTKSRKEKKKQADKRRSEWQFQVGDLCLCQIAPVYSIFFGPQYLTRNFCSNTPDRSSGSSCGHRGLHTPSSSVFTYPSSVSCRYIDQWELVTAVPLNRVQEKMARTKSKKEINY